MCSLIAKQSVYIFQASEEVLQLSDNPCEDFRLEAQIITRTITISHPLLESHLYVKYELITEQLRCWDLK